MSNTHTVPAGLAGLTIHHARQLERVGRVNVASVKGVVADRITNASLKAFFTGRPSTYTRRMTMRMNDEAIWFHGVRAQIDDGAELPDSTVDLLAELEKAQDTVRRFDRIIAEASELARRDVFASPPGAMERANELRRSLASVFDAVEGARWAVLEREADDDIAAGRVSKTFATASDVISSLRG